MAYFLSNPRSWIKSPYKYSVPAPIKICSGCTCIPRNCSRWVAIAWRSPIIPPQGGFVISSGLFVLKVSRINFAQIENGKFSGRVWLLEKSARKSDCPEESFTFSVVSLTGFITLFLKSET